MVPKTFLCFPVHNFLFRTFSPLGLKKNNVFVLLCKGRHPRSLAVVKSCSFCVLSQSRQNQSKISESFETRQIQQIINRRIVIQLCIRSYTQFFRLWKGLLNSLKKGENIQSDITLLISAPFDEIFFHSVWRFEKSFGSCRLKLQERI